MDLNCPRCGACHPEDATAEESKRLGGFQVLPAVTCTKCHHVWEPESPRWLLWVGLIAGLILFVPGLVFALGGHSFGAGLACAMGACAAFTCWKRLASSRQQRGKIGP